MWRFQSGPWAKLMATLAGIGGVIIAIGVVFAKGRCAGIAHMEAEQAARRIRAVEQRNQAADEVNAMGAQEVRDRLKEWNRGED